MSIDWVLELVDQKIMLIREESFADSVELFVTDSQSLTDQINKERRVFGEVREYTPNFRYDIAVTKPYKGTRKNPKPFHFDNILTHLRGVYDARVSEKGLEADDEICIRSRELAAQGIESVICSRDKDLRICEGTHYSWECGGQAAVGPITTDRIGWLELYGGTEGKNGKLVGQKCRGYGLHFFFYQLLVGDTADNIPGLPKWGVARAFKHLEGCATEADLFRRVTDAYVETLSVERNPRNDPFAGRILSKDEVRSYWRENADLLWMVQYLDESGDPIPYKFMEV